jgi:hypothetical protein
MDTSKASTSVMFSVSASGKLRVLPPYIVSKVQHLYDIWCLNGPKAAHYNRSKSGWFDAIIFKD